MIIELKNIYAPFESKLKTLLFSYKSLIEFLKIHKTEFDE